MVERPSGSPWSLPSSLGGVVEISVPTKDLKIKAWRYRSRSHLICFLAYAEGRFILVSNLGYCAPREEGMPMSAALQDAVSSRKTRNIAPSSW